METDHKINQIIAPKVKTYWVAGLIGLLICILTFLLWLTLENQTKLNQQTLLDKEVRKLSSYILKDIDNRILSLDRMVSRWLVHKGTSKDNFYIDAQNYITDMPGFQAIEWIDENFIARWIIPFAGNEQAENFNLGLEKNRRIAIENAKNSGKPTMTTPIDLVQGGKGFRIYFPLYINGKFNGLIAAVFRISEWLDYVLIDSEDQEQFEDIKILVNYDDVIVYKQDGWDDYQQIELNSVNSFIVMGHRLKVFCRPTTNFIKKHQSMLPIYSAAFGLLMSILISISVFIFLKANNETWRANIIKRDLEIEISERKNIEDSLYKISARLDLATKAGKVGVWSFDLTTNELTWNNIMYEIYDVPPDVKPYFSTWQNALHHDDKQDAENLFKDAINGKSVFDTEFRIILRNGSIRYIHASARVERNDIGEPISIIGVNWDISHLKLVEIELKQQTEMQKILMEISSKYINISLDELDSSIQTALAEVGQYVTADRVYVFGYDFQQETTSNLYEWCDNGITPQIKELQNLPLDGLEAFVNTHKKHQPMIIMDVSKLPEGALKEMLTHQSIKTLITIPMLNRDDLIGFVGFDWCVSLHNISDKELNLLKLFSQILVNIRMRKLNEEIILHMANHDALTGLPTMRLVKDRAFIAIQQSRRKKSMVGFMFIDLDGFKSVNDNYGHEVGDIVLKEVANRFTSCVRKTDTVARIGGDEFLVILNELTSMDTVVQIARKFLQVISRPFLYKNKQARVGVSIGISIYPNDGDDIDYLIKQADTAMYKIKNAGKNNYAFVSSDKANDNIK